MGNAATFAFNYGIIVVLSALPTGIYSAYNYSMQVLNFPNNFIVSQAAAVAGIKFNELAARKQPAEMNRIFLQSLEVLLFLMIPFCFLAYLFADVIVNFLYLRGGFTKEAAVNVVYFFKYLIFLAPCFMINTFITRLMTAGKKVSQTFLFQLGFNMSALLLIIFVTRAYKETGFVIAMLCAYYFYITVVCVFLFKWLMPFIDYYKVIKNAALIFLYNLPFLWISYELFDRHQTVPMFLLISAGYYGVVLLLNHLIKISRSADLYFSNIIGMVLKMK
jgi:peptidoglycan biosynthesis protein MviN/MurJ (putative lipid II flippase)